MRFTIALTVRGLSLDDGALRAAIVDALTRGFTVEHVAVSNGTPPPHPEHPERSDHRPR